MVSHYIMTIKDAKRLGLKQSFHEKVKFKMKNFRSFKIKTKIDEKENLLKFMKPSTVDSA